MDTSTKEDHLLWLHNTIHAKKAQKIELWDEIYRYVVIYPDGTKKQDFQCSESFQRAAKDFLMVERYQEVVLEGKDVVI